MKGPIPATVSILFLCLLAAFTWWQFRPEQRGEQGSTIDLPKASEAQIQDLRQLADAACRCDRRTPNEPWDRACWAEFDRRVDAFHHWTEASACMEESVSYVCFGEYDASRSNQCVFRQRAYGACSDEEAAIRREQTRAAGNSGCD